MESPIIDHGMERPQGPHHRSRHGPSRGASDCCCIAGSGSARADGTQGIRKRHANSERPRSASCKMCAFEKGCVEPHLSCRPRRSEFRRPFGCNDSDSYIPVFRPHSVRDMNHDWESPVTRPDGVRGASSREYMYYGRVPPVFSPLLCRLPGCTWAMA